MKNKENMYFETRSARNTASLLNPLNLFMGIPSAFCLLPSAFLTTNSSEKKLIELFYKGWVLGSLMSVKEIQTLASKYGYKLIENIDLTPNLRLRRNRDILISLYVIFFKPFMQFSSYFKALVGGDALQKCLIKKLVEYSFLVFQKV